MFEKLNELVHKINSYDGGFEYVVKYDLDTFLEEVEALGTPVEGIMAKTLYGDVNLADDYFGFDGDGNFVSYDAYEYEKELLIYGDEIISEALALNLIGEDEAQELLEKLEV